MAIRAGFFLPRAAALALLVLALDELVKSAARARLAPCLSQLAACDRLEITGPLRLVRTANAGSAYGFVQGWWGWIALALMGVLLIPLYARLLGPASRVAVLAVGLQVGGALGNLFDRLVLGGASDILYVGWGPTWNIADVAIASGTVLATYALARQRLAAPATRTTRRATHPAIAFSRRLERGSAAAKKPPTANAATGSDSCSPQPETPPVTARRF